MKIPLALALFTIGAAILCPAAHGRLGETEAAIATRYGRPAGEPTADAKKHFALADAVRRYTKSGLVVTVAFQGGKSVAEVYSRAEGGELPIEAVEALLNANKEGEQETWKAAEVSKEKGYWIRSDAGAFAIMVSDATSLEVTTADFYDAVNPRSPTPTPGKAPVGF